MATRCYFLAKETSCGLTVQQVFYFSTCFHPLTKLKISYKCSESSSLSRDVNLSNQRKRKSTGVHEKCKVMFKGKRMQGDAVLRTSKSPWDHLTQMICQ